MSSFDLKKSVNYIYQSQRGNIMPDYLFRDLDDYVHLTKFIMNKVKLTLIYSVKLEEVRYMYSFDLIKYV